MMSAGAAATTWRTVRESLQLSFNGVELRGALEHDPSGNVLALVCDDGEGEALSVDLLGAGYVAFPGEVFVRDYSEHSGLPAALVEAGACELVEVLSVGPFGSTAARMRVLG